MEEGFGGKGCNVWEQRSARQPVARRFPYKVIRLLPCSKKVDFRNQKLFIKREKTNNSSIFIPFKIYIFPPRFLFRAHGAGRLVFNPHDLRVWVSAVFDPWEAHAPSTPATELTARSVVASGADGICQGPRH